MRSSATSWFVSLIECASSTMLVQLLAPCLKSGTRQWTERARPSVRESASGYSAAE